MRLADLIVGALLAVTGLVFIFGVIPSEAVPGDEGELAPALLPTVALTVITVLACVVFVSALRRRRDAQPGSPALAVNWVSVRFFLTITAGLFGVLAALRLIGFVPAGILTVLAFSFFLKPNFYRERVLTVSIVLVALLVPVAIYFVATHGLRLSLP